jgi:hypothetical protein
LCRAASYLTCLLSGDETGHGDRAAGVTMARGDEFLAVMASLADQIGAGGVRVHKDRKAVGRGPIDRPRGGCCHPHRWLRLGEHLDIVLAIAFPLVRKPIVCPGFKDDVDRLVEPRRALFARNAEGFELASLEPATSPRVNARLRARRVIPPLRPQGAQSQSRPSRLVEPRSQPVAKREENSAKCWSEFSTEACSVNALVGVDCERELTREPLANLRWGLLLPTQECMITFAFGRSKRSFDRSHVHAQVPSHRRPSVERLRIHVKGMVRSTGWLRGFSEVGRCGGPWRRRRTKNLLEASTEGENNSLRHRAACQRLC